MPDQKIEGINPTRMELLEIRKKLSLAEKGHKLLEEKRDALVEKFFGIIDKRTKLHNQVNEKLKEAFSNLIQSQMILGENKVNDNSYFIEDIGEITFEHDNIMGVKIPKINKEKINQDLKALYSFSDTCSKLDDSQKKFYDILINLLDLSDLEGKIKSLAIEIEKTKRRVNVLENNLIPKLKSTQKYIEMQLEEREREDFFRRKRIKAIMESKKELK
jgi:V/A-type H+-transporting ATPase subunit D